jgi:capsular exopolysaccharide synthesis family protein
MIMEEGSTSFWRENRGFTGEALQGFGTSYQGISNQMIILKSKPLIQRALDELGFEVSYFHEGKISIAENYTDAPFKVVWDKTHPQLIGLNFKLVIEPDGRMTLKAKGESARIYTYAAKRWGGTWNNVDYEKELVSGDTIKVPGYFCFVIRLIEGYNYPNIDEYFFNFQTTEDLVNSYRSRLTVSMDNWETSIVDLSLKDFHPQKGVDFLNKLMEVYRIDNVDKKNEYADQTIAFIDYLLRGVSDSLSATENAMLSYQSQHRIVNLGSQSGQLLSQMNQLEENRIKLETQDKYYKYLRKYILENRDLGSVLVPASVGIDDPLLSGLLAQYNELTIEKSKMADVRISPRLTQLNTQMENVKAAMLDNIDNIINQSAVALTDLQRRLAQVESQVRRIPLTERDMMNIERKYNLNNETYTFLLEKLSEAQIAKAANQPESRVVEMAEYQGVIAPQEKKTYSYALFIGLVLPALVILLIVLLNKKVVSKEDVENITRLPILNLVFFNKLKVSSMTPVLDKPNSPESEAYRSLRSKLDLMVKGKHNPVIAVSSTAPGEGKTYTSVNIASSYALTKKRTVLLDVDLRNSRINESFNIDASKGLVSYILGHDSLNDITYKTKHPNLHIIPAGPIPPNPGEMLMDEKIAHLLIELKKHYDVIIIDSAPIGYVTDLFQIYDQIDSVVYVVRDKYTNRSLLKHSLNEMKSYKLKGVGILINAIKTTGGPFPDYILSYVNGYRYGYAYGYGDYGYGYGYMGYSYGSKSKRKRFKLPLIKETESSAEEENGTHNGRPHV